MRAPDSATSVLYSVWLIVLGGFARQALQGHRMITNDPVLFVGLFGAVFLTFLVVYTRPGKR